MVGLVFVSHSRALADALVGLVSQVTATDIPIAMTAGVGPAHQDIGTDAIEITEAIQSVYSPDGVLVLMDLGSQVLFALAEKTEAPEIEFAEPVILFAQELTPTETSQLDMSQVLGLITAGGGPTSHTAILARALGIPALSALTDALHPAVLRLIRGVVDAAHQRGKWVGVCGELAGDPLAVPVLVGLGVDELSMNPGGIPRQSSSPIHRSH